MNGARDTVLQLEVHLGNRVLGEDGGIRDITCCLEFVSLIHNDVACSVSISKFYVAESRMRYDGKDMRKKHTDSSRLDHVADSESLDRLVLRGAASAVGAAHGLDVAAAVLVAAAVQKSVIRIKILGVR